MVHLILIAVKRFLCIFLFPSSKAFHSVEMGLECVCSVSFMHRTLSWAVFISPPLPPASIFSVINEVYSVPCHIKHNSKSRGHYKRSLHLSYKMLMSVHKSNI